MSTLKKEVPRFIFHGNAMPFGGRVTKKNNRPFHETIPCAPAAALPVTGGLSRATGRRGEHLGAFRWGATLAEASGELLRSRSYQTTVTSAIAKAWARNDPHVFEADLLRITLVSVHTNLKPPSIRMTDVVFGGKRGMLLDGDRIEVEYNNDLNEAPTWSEFEKRFRGDREFFNRHQHPGKPEGVPFGDPVPRTSGGYASTSIVHRISWRNKVYEGHVLRLRGFGTIYFGEVLMNENNRRLTMVRLQMGSDLGAEVGFAEADPNGTWGV